MTLDRNDDKGETQISSELPEGTSFAKTYAQCKKNHGEQGKTMLATIHQQCMMDQSYMPDNHELSLILDNLDFSDTEYPPRNIREDIRSYTIRLYQSLFPEVTVPETTHGKTAGAVMEILEK